MVLCPTEALEDLSELARLHDLAADLEIGHAIDLVALAPDPKHLFGRLLTAGDRSVVHAGDMRARADLIISD